MIGKLLTSLLRIRALIQKEFIAMLLDSGTRKVLIVPIIVQSLIFGYGADFTLNHIGFAVFDDAHTRTSENFTSELANTPNFELTKSCPDLKCLKDAVDKQEALLGIYYDKSFKNTLTINLIADARNTASANTAKSYVSSIAADFCSRSAQRSSLTISSRFLFNENNVTRYSILTGMILALSMIQVLMLASLTVSREREEGTYDMLLMTPTTPVEILIGKAVPPVLIAIMQGLALHCICRYYFAIPFRGSFFTLLAAISFFSLAIVGLAMAISCLSNTSMQSLVTSFLIIIPSIMMSGLMTPIEAMPSWFKIAVYINPLYYGITSLWRIYLEGASLGEVIHLFIPLFIIGGCCMFVAVNLFRKKMA